MELSLRKAHVTLAGDQEMMTKKRKKMHVFILKVHWVANTKLVLYFAS